MGKQTVVAGILDSLCSPSLERWTDYESSIPLHSMISFVRYLSSCLKIFKIGIDKCDYRQIPRLLSHLPSLEFLELRSARKQPPTTELRAHYLAMCLGPIPAIPPPPPIPGTCFQILFCMGISASNICLITLANLEGEGSHWT